MNNEWPLPGALVAIDLGIVRVHLWTLPRRSRPFPQVLATYDLTDPAVFLVLMHVNDDVLVLAPGPLLGWLPVERLCEARGDDEG